MTPIFEHEPFLIFYLLIDERLGRTENHVVGVDVVHAKSCLVKRVGKTGLAYYVHRAAGALAFKERGGGKRAGIEVLLAYVKSHSRKLLRKLPRRALGGVGKEKELLSIFLYSFKEFLNVGYNSVTVVDNAVHIAYEGLFVS